MERRGRGNNSRARTGRTDGLGLTFVDQPPWPALHDLSCSRTAGRQDCYETNYAALCGLVGWKVGVDTHDAAYLFVFVCF